MSKTGGPLLEGAIPKTIAAIAALTALLITVTCPLMAQSATNSSSVDGSVHPELIPDTTAFRLFLGALAEHPGNNGASEDMKVPLGQPSRKQKAKLRAVRLNSADTSVLLRSLSDWTASLSTLPPQFSPAKTDDLDSITRATMSSLQQQMTPTGYVSLLAHVRAEKKYMRIVSVTDMTKHSH